MLRQGVAERAKRRELAWGPAGVVNPWRESGSSPWLTAKTPWLYHVGICAVSRRYSGPHSRSLTGRTVKNVRNVRAFCTFLAVRAHQPWRASSRAMGGRSGWVTKWMAGLRDRVAVGQ